MAEPMKQAVYYVVLFDIDYPSLGAALADAPAAIAAHTQRAKAWQAEGTLVMAGAFRDTPDGCLQAMGVLTSRAAAEAFAAGDPFVLNGKVRTWHIREWNNMLV